MYHLHLKNSTLIFLQALLFSIVIVLTFFRSSSLVLLVNWMQSNGLLSFVFLLNELIFSKNNVQKKKTINGVCDKSMPELLLVSNNVCCFEH